MIRKKVIKSCCCHVDFTFDFDWFTDSVECICCCSAHGRKHNRKHVTHYLSPSSRNCANIKLAIVCISPLVDSIHPIQLMVEITGPFWRIMRNKQQQQKTPRILRSGTAVLRIVSHGKQTVICFVNSVCIRKAQTICLLFSLRVILVGAFCKPKPD